MSSPSYFQITIDVAVAIGDEIFRELRLYGSEGIETELALKEPRIDWQTIGELLIIEGCASLALEEILGKLLLGERGVSILVGPLELVRDALVGKGQISGKRSAVLGRHLARVHLSARHLRDRVARAIRLVGQDRLQTRAYRPREVG